MQQFLYAWFERTVSIVTGEIRYFITLKEVFVQNIVKFFDVFLNAKSSFWVGLVEEMLS